SQGSSTARSACSCRSRGACSSCSRSESRTGRLPRSTRWRMTTRWPHSSSRLSRGEILWDLQREFDRNVSPRARWTVHDMWHDWPRSLLCYTSTPVCKPQRFRLRECAARRLVRTKAQSSPIVQHIIVWCAPRVERFAHRAIDVEIWTRDDLVVSKQLGQLGRGSDLVIDDQHEATAHLFQPLSHVGQIVEIVERPATVPRPHGHNRHPAIHELVQRAHARVLVTQPRRLRDGANLRCCEEALRKEAARVFPHRAP